MMALVQFAAGLVLLVIGAGWLVKGASRMASAFGISPLVIGLSVVAFGTSAPELAVSIDSAYSNKASIAIGSIIGSNIINILLILGVSALIAPLVVGQQLVRLDIPLLIGASALVFLFGIDGVYGRIDGAVLFIALTSYLVLLIRLSRKENKEILDEYAEEFGHVAGGAWQLTKNALLMIVSFAMLVLGSNWLVNGAIEIARYLEVDELIIALTIVAAGTSLPELVTSIIAAFRGERDIAVGNVVGSCLFNLLGVLGVAAVVSPVGIAVSDSAMRFDLPIMIAATIACLPIFMTGFQISRWEGALFVAYYLAYTLYLFLAAGRHSALPMFSPAMFFFVVPLCLVPLIVVSTRAINEIRNR
jgi:cation:H+ antiporter